MTREATGRVLAVLPHALYRVAIERGEEITAHAASGLEKNFVRLVIGDRVVVELAERDAGRGRILKRVKGFSPSS